VPKIPPSVEAKMENVLEMMNLPIGSDVNFRDTPHRWLKYIQTYTQSYDPGQDLETTFPPAKKDTESGYDRSIVIQRGIPYRAACAHHLLPVLGTAHIGYIPGDKLVGLSKLTRLVYGLSHAQPSLQEDVCDKITDAIMEHLDAIGAICVIKAEHGCMSARGVEEPTGCIDTITASVKGVFIEKAETRAEFYSLVNS
jgi:GTP cyclohydrolase IA